MSAALCPAGTVDDPCSRGGNHSASGRETVNAIAAVIGVPQ